MKQLTKNTAAAEPTADTEIETAARCAASALTALPEEKRQAAAARLLEMLAPPKTPQRAGAVLDNVVTLFKETQRQDWSASEVLKALENKGQSVEPKKVYSALTYLKDMKIIRRVGYGRYLVEGGGLLVTHERGGD